MRVLNLNRGERVTWQGAEYVILHVLDPVSVLARARHDGHTERLMVGELRPLGGEEETPAGHDVDLVGVRDEDWQEANRRFEILRPLLTRGGRTQKKMERRGREYDVHWTTLYRWIRAYQTDPRITSLLPSRSSGGRGQGRLSADVEQLITQLIDTHYLRSQKPSVQATVKEILAQCRSRGLPPPSESSVQRRIRRLSEEEAIARRRGRKAAQDRFDLHSGSSVVAEAPLALVQIDHSKMDLILVDSVERLPIGRPWLTVAIDVFSRMVLGFYVSLDPPGAVGTGLCYVHAVLPKEQWLLERGIDAVWPCWGFPHRVETDNAKEFRGKMFLRALKEYGTDLQFRPAGRPEYGAYIERYMGTVGDEIHLLPGSTFSSAEERGEYDSEGKACFTLRELEAYLGRWIATVYHQRLHRGIGRKPLALWEEGIRGTKDRPGIGLPPRVMDPTRLRIDFLPFEVRTVQQYGVVLDHVHYQDDVLRPYVDRRDPTTSTRKLSFRFHRDPRDISVIYFLDPATGRYTPIPYRDRSRPPISLWELRAARRALVQAGREEIDEDALFQAYKVLRDQSEQAKRTTAKIRRENERRDGWAGAHRALGGVAPSPGSQPTTDAAVAESDAEAAEILPFDEYDELEDV